LVSSKIGAQIVLRAVLGVHIDADAIPEQDDPSFDESAETVVEASSVKVAVDGVRVEAGGD
jgi:DEAD/DEAH box helicase domain-containing protein